MKGKVLLKNKKFFIVAIICISIIAVLLSYIRINYDKSKGLQTNYEEAALFTTNGELVKSALRIASANPYRYYCCSNYLKQVVLEVPGVTGYSSSMAPNAIRSDGKIEYNGKTYGVNVVTEGTKVSGKPWYDCIDKTKLKMGDIIVANGHEFMYLGKAGSYDILKNNILNVIGDTEANRNLFNSITVKNKQSEYWTIEGNVGTNNSDLGRCPICGQTANRPFIRSYGWENSNFDKSTVKDGTLTVLRVSTEVSGSYHLNIVKKDVNDKGTIGSDYSGALPNAKFEIRQYKNTTPDSGNTDHGETSYGNYTAKSTITTTVDNSKKSFTKVLFNNNHNVSINNTTKSDYYRITEKDAPDNYKLKGGTIQIEVKKKLDGNTYKLESVKVTAGGITDQLNDDQRTIKPGEAMQLTNSSKVASNDKIKKTKNFISNEYFIAIDMSANAITITWKDPIETKDLNIKVVKKNSKTNKEITGGTFKAYLENADKGTFSAGVKKALGTVDRGKSYYVYVGEVNPPQGYKNAIGDNLLRAHIKVSESGSLLLESSKPAVRNKDKVPVVDTIQSYYENVKIEDDTIVFTIKDPPEEKNIKVKINKLDQDGKKLSGGNFEIIYNNQKKGDIEANKEFSLGNFAYGSTIGEIYVKETIPPTGYVNKLGTDLGFADIKLDSNGKLQLREENQWNGYVFQGIGRPIRDKAKPVYSYYEDPKIEGDTLVFTIKNPPITGSYDVNIKKVDQNNNPISGVKFKVNDQFTSTTGNNGLVTIAHKDITKDTLNSDTYTISEVDLGSNGGLVRLKEPISIYVDKGLNASKDKYIATKARFEYGDIAENNGNEVQKQADLEDGTEVTVKLAVKDGVVTVTIPNKKTKPIKAKVIKKDMDGKELSGGKFQIDYGNNTIGTIAAGEEISLGEFAYDSSLEGIFIKEVTPPTDYINMLGDNLGFAGTRITSDGTLELTGSYNGRLFRSDKNYLVSTSNNLYNYYETPKIEGDTVVFTIKNPLKAGTYNFTLTKKDISNKIIKDEKTRFDVKVYSGKSESNGGVTLSNSVTLKNTKGEDINTTGIEATTGVTTALNGIQIQKEDIGKTYYFVVTETQAPDKHTEINYKVVVPITYTENESGYVATKGEAFAITNTSVGAAIMHGTKKALTEMSTNTNEVVSTDQTDVTINVNVPNKPKEGSFDIKLVKYIEGTKTPLPGAKFTVKITDSEDNVLMDSKGNSIDGTKEYTTGDDGYLTDPINGLQIESENETYTVEIKETQVPDGYIGADPITFTAKSKQGGDGYILTEETPELQNEKANVQITSSSINVEYYNTPKDGSFNFELIKYKEGTATPLSGAEFTVKIYETIDGKEVVLEDKDGNKIDGTKTYKTGSDGRLTTPITGLKIGGSGKTYKVEITETKAPDGYIGAGTITFNAESINSADNSSYILQARNMTINNKAQVNITSSVIKTTMYNTPKSGSFNFRLVKYIKNTQNLLAGAGFTVDIRNKSNNEPLTNGSGEKLDGTKEYFTSANPKEPGVSLNGLNIDKENITYKIKITEKTTPDGYIGLAGPIEFEAKSVWDANSKTYKLQTNTSTTIANTKVVEVRENEIWIETENTPAPEIHKGVKDVKNQDSGYYDNEEHTWVINSTVPLGIKDFTQYVVTDTIDNRLVFSGINKVSVRIKGDRTLVKNTDYKVSYDTSNRLLKVSFIDGNFKAGQSLPEDVTIEITFKTTFAKDANGKIIALNEEIPNQATLIYDNGSGEHTKKSEKPEVHTGGIKVFKYVDINGRKEPLEGATFKLATSEENAKNNTFVKVKDANGKDTTTDIVGKSDANGIVVFEGLEFGGDAMSNEANKTTNDITGAEVYDYEYNSKISTDYWVVETEAPEGYIKWEGPLKVTINKDSYNTEVSNMPSVPNTRITGRYSIQLKKVNKSNNPIPGATFQISSASVGKANRDVLTDENGNLDITNGDVNILANDKETGDDGTNVGTTDNYNIKELSATSYLKLKNPLLLSVYKEEKNDNYHVSKIKIKELYEANEKTLTISDSNKSITLTGVKLIDNEKTVDITVSIDNNDNISVTVPNDDIEGKYNITLLKKDSETGDVLGKIPFLINGKQKTTDETKGTINVTEDAGENGIVKITKANVGKQDVYTIEEQENENTANVAIIKSPFTLTLTKGMNSDQDAYIVKQIHIDTITTYGEGKTDIGIDPYTHTGSGNFYVATKDGQNIKCTITVNSTGEIVLELGNPSKDGGYKLKLYKSIINNDNNETELKGVQFKITDINEKDQSKNRDYTKTTATNGYTSEINKSITKDNVNITDKFKITEVSATDDKVIKLKNSLTLEVTKKVNKDNSGYTINTIKLSEDGTGKTTPAVSVDEETGATLTLNGVALLDGRTVDISVSVGNDNVITVNIKNREITGKYTLKIRKINSVTEEPINGVTFNGLDRNQISFSVVTKNDGTNDGIATIVENFPIKSSADTYKINEVSLPDNIKGDFLQLTDYGLAVTVNTKINDAKTAYVVDSVDLLPFRKGGSQTTEAQRAIIEKSTYEVDNNTITVTIYNEPTQDYNFTIKKVDMENNAIADAKFTIKENGTTILENAKLGDLGEYLVNRENQLINTTYNYEIYETEAAPGYDNVLEKLCITLTIKIDDEGNVTASANCLPDYKNGGTVWERAGFQRTLSEYIKNNEGKKFLENNGNNSWTLNIPNPRSTIDMKFSLNKHEINSEATVNGAVFGVRRLYVEKEGNSSSLSDVINKFSSGTDVTTLTDITTSSKNKNIEIDSSEGIKLGDSYYYELHEKEVPTNYISTYKKAIIRIHANDDRSITANIVAIMPTNSNDYVPYEKDKYQNAISSSTEGTNVTLNWTNSLAYTVTFNKKQFKGTTPKDDEGNTNWGGLQGLPGATFTVKQVSPEQKTIYDHQVLTDYQFFNNLEANSSTTYHYEIVEEASRDGYTNIFEGLKVHLYITTNEDGTINEAENATYYEIKDSSGNNIDATKKKYLEDKIGLKIDGSTINFYMANEEETLKIALLKVTEKIDDNDDLMGIPGVEFGITGPNQLPIYDENGANLVTDNDGYIYIEGIELNNNVQTYVITEQSVPEGVTKLVDTRILLSIDTRGLTSPDQITQDRVTVSLDRTGAAGVTELEGLSATLEGSTVVLKVPNPTKFYAFRMYKTDELGTPLHSGDGNGAPNFIIRKFNEKKGFLTVHKGALEGSFTKYEICGANATYRYKIEETAPKPGYINILQGYDLYVDIETDANANVKDTENNGIGGYTKYRLVKRDNEEQLYTEEELINGGYINLSLNKSERGSTINLYIKNPYAYNVTINKKSKSGDVPVNKATILAERIDGVKARDLFSAEQSGNTEAKRNILKEIVNSNNKSKEVKLDKKTTVTSDDIQISEIGRVLMPVDDKTQVWRIKETDVESPYINALGDNYIIVQTTYREGALDLETHTVMIDNKVTELNYYVCDKNGNDITEQYLNVVDAKTEQIDGKWNLAVTVKDPLKFYVDLNKAEYNPDVEDEDDLTALGGAELTITSNKGNGAITNGGSKSESIPVEINPYEVVQFTIKETKSAPGHKNILENKELNVMVRSDENGNAEVVGTIVVDTSNGGHIEYNSSVLNYVKFIKGTTQDGYPIIHVYVENPIEYKFKLQKQDSAGNPLTGTEIEVSSSHSGMHYLNAGNQMEFVESNLKPGDIISYNIREIRTVQDSAYVNVFSTNMTMIVRVNADGTIKEVMAFYLKPSGHGAPDMAPISELDFLDYGISDADSDGMQTINFTLQNPTKIDVELLKKQAGEDGASIANTDFTIISSFSGDHSKLTDSNGKIGFTEETIRPGKYTYRVMENKAASDSYVNILEGKYMKVDITVAADGKITIDDTKYYYLDDDDNYDNDRQITDVTLLAKLQKYTFVDKDDSNPVQKLLITVKNPVTTEFTVYKNKADGGTPLANTEFEIKSDLSGTTKVKTDDNGIITIDDDEWIDPGVYKYEVTETKTSGKQYNNILEGHKIIIYVNISATGNISFVKDKNGTPFDAGTKYEYSIEKIDGSEPSNDVVNRIHEYAKLNSNGRYMSLNVTNPTGYIMNIIKKNSAGNDISDTTFTVIRDYNVTLLNRGKVTTGNEITEQYMSDGLYTFDITENSTKPNSAYVNMLDGKFIRVYAELKEDGTLKVKDGEVNTVPNYFEIYRGDIKSSKNAKLLDREEFAYLYDLISVRAVDDDNDGVYTLEVTVTNPINIDVEILKKQVGKDGAGISNTKFTIIRDENHKHENILTDNDGQYNFTEERIMPGDYTYKVEELETASPKYINILKGKYLEVYINVAEDGVITIKGHKIFNFNETGVDANIENTLNKYIDVAVDKTSSTQKLVVTVYNPVTIDFNLYKEDISGVSINGANFTIKRTLVKAKSETSDKTTKVVTKNTENQGSIEINEGWIDPGVYKYEVTENNTAGPQYTNILQNCKIVAYVEVAENGDVTLVADKDGTRFGPNVKYKYYIEGNGSVVDAETQNIIHRYIVIGEQKVENSNDEVDLRVINPVEYKVDIIKNDQRGEALSGTKFTVTRDNNIKVMDNQDITTAVELTEKYLSDGEHTYYITEDSTVPGYINILNGKFIKVYTELTGTGVLKVKDPEANTNPKYFEIYEGSIDDINKAKLLDRSEYSDLYGKIDVESVEENGVYTLKVKVENPDITYNLILNKKIFGDEAINLSNTRFTVISQFSGRHVGVYTDKNGNISLTEERVPAGIYRYLITETRTSGKQFVNVLDDDTYIEIMLKVNEDGTIEIVDEDGNVAENTYYLYKQRPNSSLLDKLDFADTVADEFISVGTSVKDKIPELDIFVKNPEVYNFELIKIDKDTKEKMNGVEFTLNVFDENNNKVELKDGETLENLITGKVVTGNVNGIDGVIRIPNILVEKAGKYTFVLHEESTEGLFDCLYKSWATDIKVKVEIVVQNGEYIVKTPTITQGEKYVESANATTSKSQTAQVEVTNERIKGSYDLVIDKLDSYTDRTLNGAEFDLTVEKDGQEYVLYKSTDDVTSKDVIIPDKFTVNGELRIPNIRIERPETYTIILTETKAPEGYMLLDKPIKIEVTTTRNGEYDDEEYIVESVKLIDDENHELVTVDNEDKVITVTAKNEYFDLSLRKSITSVSYSDSDDGKITEDETKDRIPDVITTDLLANKDTTADYNHVKNHVRAYTSQEVIYTLRVYNEGEIDGYAEEITDHLPEGLEFVNDNFNAERGWKLDADDPTLRTVKTTYLSKENNPNNDKYNSEKNLIKAMDKVTGELDYKEIQIKCKISDDVKAKTVLTNIAEISISKANDRTSETVDRDSVTNNVKVPETSEEMSGYQENNLTDNRNDYVPGQEDDDDFEKLIVEEFDLALRKYIVAVNDEELLKNNEENTEDKTDSTNENDTIYEREPIVNVDSLKDGSSTTATYTHTKEPVEVSAQDIVTYTLEVYNEGTVSGYASLIKDDIPEGLEFVTYTEGDGSTNDIYRWKMVDENDNEVTDPAKAKYVVSDYLSKANEVSENGNLINAYDPSTMSTVDSKYVRVAFRVVCKQDYPKVIKNEAQISEDSDESGKPVKDRDSVPNEWLGEDDEDVEYVRVTYMDLALRKFITAVKDEVTGEEKEVTTRIPQVDASALISETGTTAKYTHPKDPVLVHTTDVVTYTLRVYNEGSKDGYATQIKDDIPDGLEFLPDNETNKEYEWKLVDENDNVVTDISKAKYVVTNYLSKDNETDERQNLMKAFDFKTMKTPEYKDVKIAFKVVEPSTSDRILINYAQISEQTDGKGIHREDRDSVPNKWQGEDDEDIEKVRVQYFDLALRKWVTKAIVIQNGAENVTETGHHAEDNPEEVVKVDLKKSKLNSVVVKFEYQIRITNEGEIAGYAKEIKDHIPDGLRFEAADNQNWVQLDDKTITTDELKDTLLQPGESAEVTVVLTWINSETNMGVKVNIAEISKDYNDYGTPDIDSTPDNEVPGEDDIDDAPVMLTVKTGANDLRYIGIVLGVLAILGLGVSLIRDELNKSNVKKSK